QIPRPLHPTLFPYTTLFRSSSFLGSVPRIGPAPACSGCTLTGLTSREQNSARSCLQDLHLGILTRTRPRNGVPMPLRAIAWRSRSEEHTSELQSRGHLVCRL